MRILVTGAAGFVGYHTCKALLARGIEVIGVDECNAYYDVRLKQARLAKLQGKFTFHLLNIVDQAAMLLLGHDVEFVIHLAAQAGVRYSIDNPFAYATADLTGHLSV